MLSLIGILLGWLPLQLQILCDVVILIFTIVVLLRVVAFIKDLIPFL